MPNILIRDMPIELHRKLKAQAEAERRSMNQQILYILESSLGGGKQAAPQEGSTPPQPLQTDAGVESPASSD